MTTSVSLSSCRRSLFSAAAQTNKQQPLPAPRGGLEEAVHCRAGGLHCFPAECRPEPARTKRSWDRAVGNVCWYSPHRQLQLPRKKSTTVPFHTIDATPVLPKARPLIELSPSNLCICHPMHALLQLSAAAEFFHLDDSQKDMYLGGYLMAAFFLVGAPAALLVGEGKAGGPGSEGEGGREGVSRGRGKACLSWARVLMGKGHKVQQLSGVSAHKPEMCCLMCCHVSGPPAVRLPDRQVQPGLHAGIDCVYWGGALPVHLLGTTLNTPPHSHPASSCVHLPNLHLSS